MKKIVVILTFSATFLFTTCAQKTGKKDYLVTIKTTYGDMVAILYDETPKHKANFIKLAKEKYFDSLLFHRVISGFMIQSGDPQSKKAAPGQPLGGGGPGYTIDAEFSPALFHEKGALSAARLGDDQNPTMASSGSQFYIVQGRVVSETDLSQLEVTMRNGKKNQYLREILGMPKYAGFRNEIMIKQQGHDAKWLNSFFENSDTLIVKEKPGFKPFSFAARQREAYEKNGGAPHLDGDYTVFGKVIKGLGVIDKIASTQTNPSQGDRPLEDIRIFVTVQEVSKKEITKEFGYQYPSEK